MDTHMPRHDELREPVTEADVLAHLSRSRKPQSQLSPLSSALHDRERLSRQNIMSTLRLRIKMLEEKNRELTGRLELVYGELALAREKNISVGGAP